MSRRDTPSGRHHVQRLTELKESTRKLKAHNDRLQAREKERAGAYRVARDQRIRKGAVVAIDENGEAYAL